MIIKRLVYLGYYFRNMDFDKLSRFIRHVSKGKPLLTIRLWIQMLHDSFKYNISPLEYFLFGFYEKLASEKLEWVGTGTMYEYQRVMNPIGARVVLDDKRKFGKAYSDLILHQTISLDDLRVDHDAVGQLLKNPSGRVVFKVSNGKCGRSVEIVDGDQFSVDSLIAYMESKGYDLVEEYVEQHCDMARLSPSGVNTVRMITQLDAQGNVELLGCRQRISVDSPVDNMAAGNLVAAIDEETGVIFGKAYYSDITKPPVAVHPVTGVTINGFQVPFWAEIVKLVKAAALLHPCNRSVGWDVVVTDRGPGLIEGNHDWCKLVWQIPVQKGLKPILDRYLSEYLQAEEGIRL